MPELKDLVNLNKQGGVFYEAGRASVDEQKATLFVGLGGTGADMLLRIKNDVLTRLTSSDVGENGIPRNIAFLEIDTDQAIKDKAYGVAAFDKHDEDLAFIPVADMARFVEGVLALKRAGDETWAWVDDELHGGSSQDGAGGYRQVGRLMLMHNIELVRTKVQGIIRKLQNAAPGHINIILLFGIAGGTGSGTFLDMAYILRDIAQNGTHKYGSVTMMAYIAMPQLNALNGGKYDQLMGNGFAALKELDYWMSADEHQRCFHHRYSASYEVNTFPAVEPFNFCHLISSQNLDGSAVTYGGACRAVADHNVLYIVRDKKTDTDGTSTMRSVYDNIAGGTALYEKIYPANYRYISIGASKVEFPYMEICTLFAGRIFERLAGKLTPEENIPSQEEFNRIAKKAQMTEPDLLALVQKDLLPSPALHLPFSYGKIWGSNSDEQKRLLQNWEARVQPQIKANAASLPGIVEGLFLPLMESLMRDHRYGPVYVKNLLKSNGGSSLIPVIKSWRDHWTELYIQQEKAYSVAANELNHLFVSGQGVWATDLIGKNRKASDYSAAYKELQYCALTWFSYREGRDALDKIVMRLEKYYELVNGLCAELEPLPDVFDKNTEIIITRHKKGEFNHYLISPIEFEQQRKGAVDETIDAAAQQLFSSIVSELGRWIGYTFSDIDVDVAHRIGHPTPAECLSEFVSNQFKEILNVNFDDLLRAKADKDGKDLDTYVTNLMKDEMEKKAVPMFHKNSGFGLKESESINFISVPIDSVQLLLRAVALYGKNNVSKSTEISRMFWVKFAYCLPLYAFKGIEDLEKVYESRMDNLETRRGCHLWWQWRDDLPSPIVESSWVKSHHACEHTKTQNAERRKVFDDCLKAGILRLTSDKHSMEYGVPKQLPDFKAYAKMPHTTPQQREARLLQERDKAWFGEGAEVFRLNANCNFVDTMGSLSADEKTIIKIRENTLRFSNICAQLKDQLELHKTFKEALEMLQLPAFFAQSLITKLATKRGIKIVLCRAKDDPMPLQLYDTREKAEFPEYAWYEGFSAVADKDVLENIKTQYDQACDDLLTNGDRFDPEKLKAWKEGIDKIINRFNGELARVIAMTRQMRIEDRGPFEAIRYTYENILTALKNARDIDDDGTGKQPEEALADLSAPVEDEDLF